MKNDRVLVVYVVLMQFLLITDFMLLMPLGPELADYFNIQVEHAAWASAGYTLAAAISGIILSKKLDRLNRKKTLFVCLFFMSIGIGATALSHDFYELIAFRTLCGALSAPCGALAMALIIDHCPIERRGKAFAQLALSFSFAAIAGVPLGLQLAAMVEWRWVFICIASLLLLLTLLCPLLLPESTRPQQKKAGLKFRALYQEPRLASGLLIMATAMVAAFMFIPHLAAIFQMNFDYPREQMGQLYLTGGLATIVITQVTGRLVDRFGAGKVSWVVCLAGIVNLITGFYMAAMPVLIIFMFFMSLNGARNLITQTLISQLPEPHHRAGYMAIVNTVRNVVTGIAVFVSAQILVTTPDNTLDNVPVLAVISSTLMLVLPVLITRAQRLALTNRANNTV